MDRTLEQEIWMMLIYLCLDSMGKIFEVGLEAVATDEEDAIELGALYRELRGEILGMARTDIMAAKMAKKEKEREKIKT